MKAVFMGTPDFAVPSLKKMAENGYEIAAVFTQPDKPKGRGGRLASPPVKEFAVSSGIPVYQPDSLKREIDVVLPILKEISPDIIVVAAYGKILPPQILSLPRFGCVNVHGSLLPKYRGAAPIQWTVLNGDKTAGVTTMMMAEGLDTGDMLLKRSVDVLPDETASELYSRLSFVGAELLIETLEALKNGCCPVTPQNESEATYAPMLSKAQSRIDFTLPAEKVHSQILGLSDWPCAECILNGKRLKIYRSNLVGTEKTLGAAGEIINEKDFTVACGKGAVRFAEVQAEGSKRMLSADYLRGKPVKKGTVLL